MWVPRELEWSWGDGVGELGCVGRVAAKGYSSHRMQPWVQTHRHPMSLPIGIVVWPCADQHVLTWCRAHLQNVELDGATCSSHLSRIAFGVCRDPFEAPEDMSRWMHRHLVPHHSHFCTPSVYLARSFPLTTHMHTHTHVHISMHVHRGFRHRCACSTHRKESTVASKAFIMHRVIMTCMMTRCIILGMCTHTIHIHRNRSFSSQTH